MTSSLPEERPSAPLHPQIEQMLTEAQVVLPGAQALFSSLLCRRKLSSSSRFLGGIS